MNKYFLIFHCENASPRHYELNLLAVMLMPKALVSHGEERFPSFSLYDILNLEMRGMNRDFEVCQAQLVHGAETEAKTSDPSLTDGKETRGRLP